MSKRITKSQWSIAAVALVLGNLANILESVKKLSGDGYAMIVFFWHGSRAIPIGFAVVGYALLGVLAFRWLETRIHSKPLAMGAAFAPAFLLFAANLLAVPVTRTPTSVWDKDLNQVRNRLLSANSGQGFRWDPGNPKSEVDAWGTAQSVLALLSDPATAAQHKADIRGALTHLQEIRLTDGWGYFPDNDWSLTEITSWITIASIHALHAGIWEDAQRQQRIMDIDNNLAVLVSRQDDSGGWRPIRESADALTRTYSTTMALWALVDARAEPMLSASVGDRYDESIRRGVNWLLVHRNPDPPGWVPNPTRGNVRETFPGLTAQVLFVLARADKVNSSFVNSRSAYKEAKEAFLKSLQLPSCVSQLDTRTPDVDVHLRPTDRVLEGSTFLWFPWTVATLSDFTVDESLSTEERQAADQLRDEMLSKHDEVSEGLGTALSYQLSENLIGISHALQVLGSH
jgi:hypothetical protein